MTRTAPLTALAALVVLAAAGAQAENLQINPGKWHTRAESTNSMIPTPRVDEKTECVTQGEWDPSEFMGDDGECTWSDVRSSATKLEWKVTCAAPGGDMVGKAVYTSTGDRVDGKMHMEMNAGGMEIVADVKYEAKRLGDCDS